MLPQSRTIWLTPALARHFLSSENTLNRPISRSRAERYAEDIRADNWHFNGDPMRIDVNGVFRDGQHRCEAVILADKAILVVLIEGLDLAACETIDQGRSRSVADVLNMQAKVQGGPLNGRVVASAASTIYRIELGQEHFEQRVSATVAQVRAIVERRPILLELVRLALAGRHILSTSVLGAVTALGADTCPIEARRFIQLLASGEIGQREHPIYELRERMLARTGKMPHLQTLALVIKAWNAYIEGRTVRVLRFMSTERLPAIVGYVRTA